MLEEEGLPDVGSNTGGLRLELLATVCPIGLTQAGGPEVRVGGQDGRQVDG